MRETDSDIMKVLLEIKGTVTENTTDIKLITQQLETVCKDVNTHDKILFGDPENMGKNGVVATVQVCSALATEHEKILKGNGKEGLVNIIESARSQLKGGWKIVAIIAAIISGLFNGLMVIAEIYFGLFTHK